MCYFPLSFVTSMIYVYFPLVDAFHPKRIIDGSSNLLNLYEFCGFHLLQLQYLRKQQRFSRYNMRFYEMLERLCFFC